MPARRPRRRFGASQKDRIFFACLPDVETAARIHRLAEEIKREHALGGTLILPDHLHVTLFHLGDWHSLPDDVVRLATEAAGTVAAEPFEVIFNRAGSFSNRTGVYPLVLTGFRTASRWNALHATLAAALKRAGLGAATQSEFKPHVTLLRDDTRVQPYAIEPVSWTVRDFVLIHSVLGKTEHRHLGQWRLQGLPAG